MSSAAGPSIATSGLVLDIDMSNTQKSWKGKPTTNLVITKVENYTGWGGAGWWMHPGNTTSLTSQILPDGNIGITLTATALTTGGLYGYNTYALGAAYVSGTQYTSSFWAKSYNGVASLNVRDADSGGALSTGVSGITDSWKLFSLTWTANASTNMLTFTGSNFSLYNVQLETNSFATPFVNGTRSNTQAIVDLTNNNTLTATSLTYASDNTFSFNGSNNYLTINNFPTKPTTAITCEAWIKPTKSVLTGTIRGGAISATNSMYLGIIDSIDGGVTHALHWANQTSVSRVTSWNGNIPNNAWSHIIGTYDGATMKAYINGIEVYSAAQTGTITDATYVIGTYGGALQDGVHNFNGLVPISKIYNRALSTAEVKQNFNATRSRYGL